MENTMCPVIPLVFMPGNLPVVQPAKEFTCTDETTYGKEVTKSQLSQNMFKDRIQAWKGKLILSNSGIVKQFINGKVHQAFIDSSALSRQVYFWDRWLFFFQSFCFVCVCVTVIIFILTSWLMWNPSPIRPSSCASPPLLHLHGPVNPCSCKMEMDGNKISVFKRTCVLLP